MLGTCQGAFTLPAQLKTNAILAANVVVLFKQIWEGVPTLLLSQPVSSGTACIVFVPDNNLQAQNAVLPPWTF